MQSGGAHQQNSANHGMPGYIPDADESNEWLASNNSYENLYEFQEGFITDGSINMLIWNAIASVFNYSRSRNAIQRCQPLPQLWKMPFDTIKAASSGGGEVISSGSAKQSWESRCTAFVRDNSSLDEKTAYAVFDMQIRVPIAENRHPRIYCLNCINRPIILQNHLSFSTIF